MISKVLLTGTDPEDPRGGIGAAMAGFASALDSAGLLADLVPSYRPRGSAGRRWLAVRAAGGLVSGVRRVRRGGGVPVVYAHGGGWLGLLRQSLLLAAVRLFGARTMLQLHSIEIDDMLRSGAGKVFLAACLASADRTCVPTEWWRARLARSGVGGIPCVVPNPLPPGLEEEARRGGGPLPADPVGSLRLLTVTRLVAGKGVDLALRALSELPDAVHLTVAGDGDQRPRLEALAAELGLASRVEFVGWVTGERKTDLFRSSHAFVLPTRRDSFGMGFVEAMAHGLPVVALRWGPVPDVVPDGVAGILVDTPEPRAIAGAIRDLLVVERRRRLGEAGRGWVLDRFAAAPVGATLRDAVSGLGEVRPAGL